MRRCLVGAWYSRRELWGFRRHRLDLLAVGGVNFLLYSERIKQLAGRRIRMERASSGRDVPRTLEEVCDPQRMALVV